MTEASVAAASAPTADYLGLWAAKFSQVLGQITGAPLPCVAQTQAPAAGAAPSPEDLWSLVASSGGLRGEMSLRIPPPTVLHLAQAFMSEPVKPEVALTADHRDAVIELLRQVAGLVATSAKARWGEIQLRVEMAAAAPSWPPAETFWLEAGAEASGGMMLEAGLSAALVAELRAEKVEADKTEAGASSAAMPTANSGAPAGAMDLLMDVQLAVTMRFGSRSLLLREVLDLSPGSVVELDRRVQDPVDLLLDGKLVARGEVVVIDGNYGLRVTDASPLAPPAGTP